MGKDGRDDRLRRGAELGIAVVQPPGEVLIGAAAERRDEDPHDGQEDREAADKDTESQSPVAFGQQDVGAEPEADERQFLLDEKG